jgi:hypothetical protein
MGIAIEGHFPMYTRDRKPKHTELTVARVQAGREAIRQATAIAPNVRYVTAHRCWSGKRLADPGQEIWSFIVEPMINELDLKILPDVDKDNGGRFIPLRWTP